ncbi:MAG: hypothetical protein WCR72_19095 [Bacteroidota bacterium]
MKKIILTFSLSIALLAANAQYKQSLGLAFGNPSGISYKTFLTTKNALDLTLGGFNNYFMVAGMYEIHQSLGNDLQWYYGPGAHIGSWSGHNYGSGAFLGVDGAIGLEFTPDVPFAFSVDLRPGINVIGNNWNDENHWFFWQSQLSVRYIFR